MGSADIANLELPLLLAGKICEMLSSHDVLDLGSKPELSVETTVLIQIDNAIQDWTTCGEHENVLLKMSQVLDIGVVSEWVTIGDEKAENAAKEKSDRVKRVAAAHVYQIEDRCMRLEMGICGQESAPKRRWYDDVGAEANMESLVGPAKEVLQKLKHDPIEKLLKSLQTVTYS